MSYENLHYLKNVINKEITDGEISGSSIRVIHNNKVVYDEVFGYADMEKGIPTGRDTIYRLFSMTKPITSVAAMILYERGMLDLLSPVSDYLEGFSNQKVWTKEGLIPVTREVTIQDLLNMTSGLVYPDEGFEAGRLMGKLFEEADERHRQGKPMDTLEFCNRIGQMPLEFMPGETWRYGTSADVLGAVIEIVSKSKLGKFFRKEIFEPLGMIDTDFYVPKDKKERFAVNYNYNTVTHKLEPFYDGFLAIYDQMTPPAFESGGAGLVSTVEDYSRFALMLAGGGSYDGKRILGRKTVDYLAAPQLSEKQAATYNWDTQYGYSYGNLMRHLIDPIQAASNGTIGEYGWDGWTGNYFFIDPKENLVMVYMIQRCNGGNAGMRRRMRQIIYGAI